MSADETSLRRLAPETLRECALVQARTIRPLTPAEAAELLLLQTASDLANELRTETRTFPRRRTNFHE